MRLYLASSRLGDTFPELLRLAGQGARVAVVSNALDAISQESRAAYARTVFDPVAHFRENGLQAHDLDLRLYFGRGAALAEVLVKVDLVWAVGGNAFLLRRAMRQSGFDAIVPGLVWANQLMYGGWSAGACVAGPTLRGLERMDDPAELADGYAPETVWEGLGLIDGALVPHYGSDHPEARAAAVAATWMRDHGVPHRTLRDGDVLIQNGEDLELRVGRA